MTDHGVRLSIWVGLGTFSALSRAWLALAVAVGFAAYHVVCLAHPSAKEGGK